MAPIRGNPGEIHELARYEVRPEALDRCIAAIHEFVAYVRANEAGALRYEVWQDATHPTRFVHIFVWKDAEANRIHGESAAVKKFAGILYPNCLAPVEFVEYTQIDANSAFRKIEIAQRKGSGMAKLVFGMNQSLDGYVDHMAFAPSPTLFRHFIEEVQGQAGSVYGRQMYEVMRYWDDDHPEWNAEEYAFAAAWRNQPKWVVSRSLKSVGPNARLVEEDLEGAIRELKTGRDGEIEVAGPHLAQSLTERGLIDEYRIYLHPVVLGHGKPYFAGPRPRLRLLAHDRIDADVIRLAYVPA